MQNSLVGPFPHNTSPSIPHHHLKILDSSLTVQIFIHIIHLEITLNNSNEIKFRNFLFTVLFYLIFTGCLQPLCLSGTYGAMLPFHLKTTSLKTFPQWAGDTHFFPLTSGGAGSFPTQILWVQVGKCCPLRNFWNNNNHDGDSGGGSGEENKGNGDSSTKRPRRNAIPGNSKFCRADRFRSISLGNENNGHHEMILEPSCSVCDGVCAARDLYTGAHCSFPITMYAWMYV